MPGAHQFVQILSDVITIRFSAPVEIKLYGPDLNRLEAYARSISRRLRDSGRRGPVQWRQRAERGLDMRQRGRSDRVGLTPETVAAAAMGALLGAPAGEIRLEDRSIAVRVRAPDSVRFNRTALGALPIVSSQTGATIPLGTLANFEPVETRGELLRENQQQMIAMTSDVSGRSLGSVIADVKKVLGTQPPPPGIRLELGGQYASQQDAFRGCRWYWRWRGERRRRMVPVPPFVELLIVLPAAPPIHRRDRTADNRHPFNVSSFVADLLVGLSSRTEHSPRFHAPSDAKPLISPEKQNP